MNYYSEWDAGAAAWLRQLIEDGIIPKGHVDERSIVEVTPSDLRGYTQAHFFCGVGGWLRALQLAGWPEDRPVWTASLPCFTGDTLVLTDTGYRPIQDLRVGDHVLTHLGNWKPITAVMQTGNRPTIRIRAQGLPEVTTTTEHPFYVRRSSNDYSKRSQSGSRTTRRKFAQPEWLDAGELTGRDFVGQVIPSDERPTDLSHAMWKIVGRWVADGWNSQYQRVVLGCGKSKADGLRDDLRNAGLEWNEQCERSVIKFHISSKILKDKCAMFGEYAYGKKIPREILDADRETAEAFLEGYFSGDGHFHKNGPSIDRKFTTVSRPLALGVALLAHKVWGVVASVRRCPMPATTVIEGRTVNQRDFYVVAVPERNRSAFIDGNYGWKRVSSVVEGVTQDVWNISVQDDESYCVEGAIVHNCQPFSSAGKQRGTADERHLWPVFAKLVRECRPTTILGEQVSSKVARNDWFTGVCLDLEGMGYAAFGSDICAPCAGEVGEGRIVRGDQEAWERIILGAPHIRQRLYWVACRMGDSASWGLQGSLCGEIRPERKDRSGEESATPRPGSSGRMADTFDDGLRRRPGEIREEISGSQDQVSGQRDGAEYGTDSASHRMAQPRNDGAGSIAGQARHEGRETVDTGAEGLRQDHGAACTGGADPRGAGESGRMDDPDNHEHDAHRGRNGEAGGLPGVDRPTVCAGESRGAGGCDGRLGDAEELRRREGITESRGLHERDGAQGKAGRLTKSGGSQRSRLGDTRSEGSQGHAGNVGDGGEPGRQYQEQAQPAWEASWADSDTILCADGKARRFERSIFPLSPRLPRGVVPSGDPGSAEYANATGEARVMRLKGYGNAICAPLAAMFISTCMEVIPE